MALTKRMEALKKRLYEVEYKDPGVWHFQDTNILDEWPEIIPESLVVRKGYAQKYIGAFLPAIIKDDELIVGNPNQNSVGWGSVLPVYYTKEEGEIGTRYELNESSVWGHHPPHYRNIIDMGTLGVKAKIQEAIDRENSKEKPDQMSLDNYKAMTVALEGLEIFAERHSELAYEMAQKCEDEVRRSELLKIHEVCKRIPLNPAESFHEAVQAFWFTYAMVNSGGEFVPLGRADQAMYPYYERDIREGKISQEEADDILASFLVKCNERIVQDTKLAENHYNFGLFSQGKIPTDNMESGTNQTGGYETRALTWQEEEDIHSEANFNYGQSGNDWLMNCMVGGVHPDGSDATNRVSHMFVEIMHEMELLMPTLGARFHKDTPQEFKDLVARVLRYGRGEPMIYNDEEIIPGFLELGVPIEDAREYSNDGCWETLVAGKSHFSYAHVMNLRCIEWVFSRGVSKHNGDQEGLDTGDPLKFETFEEFYQAYSRQVEKYIDMQCERRLENFGLSYMIAPDPLMSSIMDDCIDSGRDISQDGARYIFHMISFTGLSCTVDSLMAIKKLIYDDKVVTMEEMRRALQDNWVGHDKLRAKIMNKIDRFGNDIEEVDDIAVRALKDFEDKVSEWNKRGERILFTCGIGTFENYAALGRDIGATPDGRFDWDALASNYSPVPGADISGPTSVIKSITKPELVKYFSGSPLDLSINSKEVEGEAGIVRLSGMIESFCDLGGQILTVTSTNVNDLKDAKVNPDKHRSLMVRMGGLSAYFVAMSPVQQDNIIKRFSR